MFGRTNRKAASPTKIRYMPDGPAVCAGYPFNNHIVIGGSGAPGSIDLIASVGLHLINVVFEQLVLS